MCLSRCVPSKFFRLLCSGNAFSRNATGLVLFISLLCLLRLDLSIINFYSTYIFRFATVAVTQWSAGSPNCCRTSAANCCCCSAAGDAAAARCRPATASSPCCDGRWRKSSLWRCACACGCQQCALPQRRRCCSQHSSCSTSSDLC